MDNRVSSLVNIFSEQYRVNFNQTYLQFIREYLDEANRNEATAQLADRDKFFAIAYLTFKTVNQVREEGRNEVTGENIREKARGLCPYPPDPMGRCVGAMLTIAANRKRLLQEMPSGLTEKLSQFELI